MDSVICASCVGFVTTYNNFVATYDSTEEKLSLYREIQQGADVIKLSSVLRFLSKDVPTNNFNIKKESALDNTGYGFEKANAKEEVTRHRSALKKHLLVHKDISEVQMHKCEMCEFQTKYRTALKKHSLSHKNTSEVRLFRCKTCEYQTNHKGTLTSHLLSHNHISEVGLYKCEMCGYQTKHRGSFWKAPVGPQEYFDRGDV
ncbi:hypothetical protein NQ317_016212 [Molorchus minor]|uniref:C2H2-type domain-containing protein n=1 Tax=Molorchus minor TaxID=1323400 RepID=A0ABQ9J8X4_9CUCU|nr:hypothetical protein NQ317_016212 [Molorchus minor]